MCFDGSFCRLSPGTASPVSSNTSGAPKQATAQTPVKTENCCAASSLVGRVYPSSLPVGLQSNLQSFREAQRYCHNMQGAHVPDVIPLQGNLLDAEFRTDDFRINYFKVCVFCHARCRGPGQFIVKGLDVAGY